MTWRLLLLLLASQLSALSSQLLGAELYGQFLNANSTPYTNEVLFRALSTPLNANPRIIAGGDFRVTPDTNGNFTLQLQPGDYRVFSRLDSKGFVISVPDTTNSYLINSRITSALTYTPAAMVLGGATNVPKAASATSGLVKTDTSTADPVVYLKATVDTLMDGKIASVATMADLVGLAPSQVRAVRIEGRDSVGDGGAATYFRTTEAPGRTNAVHFPDGQGAYFKIDTSPGFITTRQWGLPPGIYSAEAVAILTNMIAWNAQNGLVTKFSSGVYSIETNIWTVSNTVLDGEPNAHVLRRFTLQSRYDRALFSVKDAPRPDSAQEVTEVPVVATNITIRNITVGAAGTNYLGPLISLCGVDGGRVEGVNVLPGAYDYSVTFYGHNVIATGNRIRSVLPGASSTVYTDGIHVLGGTNGVIANNLFETGDDNVAFTSFGNVPIVGWMVSANVHKSWRGQAVRLEIERDWATNQIKNIVVQGGVGEAGILQNSGITAKNNTATNNPYPFQNISIRGYKLQMGGLANHLNGVPNGQAAGVFMDGCDGLLLDDIQVSATPYQSFYIYRSKNVTLQNCVGDGGQWTNFNSTLRLEGLAGDTKVIGGRFSTVTNNTPTALISGVSNLVFLGTTLLNNSASSPVLQASSVQSGLISMIGCSVTNSGPGLLFVLNPVRAVLVGNHVLASTGASWQASSPPTGAVIEANYGISSLGRSVGLGYDVLNSAGTAYIGGIDVRGNLETRLLNTNGMFMFSQDQASGGAKSIRLGFQPSLSSGKPIALFVGSDGGSFPQLLVGYGSSLLDGPRWMNFGVAASDYSAGVYKMTLANNGLKIDPSGSAGSPSSDSTFEVKSYNGNSTGSRPMPSLTGAQWGAITPAAGGLWAYQSDLKSPAVSTGVSTNSHRQILPFLIAQGDADVTLLANFATGTTYTLAAPTSNRTVTLPSAGVRTGDIIRFTRPATGNFTWSIGSAITLPALTKCWAEVQYDGSAWVAIAYGTLP